MKQGTREQNEKYPIVDYIPEKNSCEGIDGQAGDLKLPFATALVLKRTAVIRSPILASVHNSEKAAVTSWPRYFDLSKTEIYKRNENNILKRKRLPLQWISGKGFFNKVPIQQGFDFIRLHSPIFILRYYIKSIIIKIYDHCQKLLISLRTALCKLK